MSACREVCYKRQKIIYGFHGMGLHLGIYVKSRDVNCIYNWHKKYYKSENERKW